MSSKSRKLSLDSNSLDGDARRGSGLLTGRKIYRKQSLQEAQQAAPQSKYSPDARSARRELTIPEESLEKSDGLIRNQSFQKHNKTFHKLFQEVPEEEKLTHTFTCALQKEVLYHGRLFVSEHHVCFYSSVLLKDTKVVIPISSVLEVKKYNSPLSMLSIETTAGEKHSLASLRNREMCYRLLQDVCSNAKEDSTTSSTPPSSTENEVEHDSVSCQSSLDESLDPDLRNVRSDLPLMRSRDSCKSSCQCLNGLSGDSKDVSWLSRFFRKAVPSFIKSLKSFTFICYIYFTLLLLMLLASGYMGVKITTLEEQLNFLGSISEPSPPHTKFKEG